MDVNWNEILSAVLQAVLLVSLPPLAVGAYKWLSAKAQEILVDLKAWQPELVDFVQHAASFAVSAAEQAGAAKLIEDKKNYAIEVAVAYLAAKGVNVDLALIEAAIEKAVREEINAE